MSVNTYGDISQRTAAHAMVDMLDHARPVNILAMFGQPKAHPAQQGRDGQVAPAHSL